MKLRILAFIFAALLTLPASALEHTKDSLSTILKNVQEKKAVLVDVRSQKEYDQGHLKKSIFLPVTELQDGMSAKQLKKKLPEEKILYTFCVAGYRSLDAAEILEPLAYKVRPLKDGYKELVEAGFEVAEEKKK